MVQLSRLAGCLLATAALAAPAAGVVPQDSNPSQVSRDEVTSLKARIEGAAGLDAAERDALVVRCDAALLNLDGEAKSLAEAARFDQLAREAPAQLTGIEAELARPPTEISVEAPEGAAVAFLEDQQRQAQAELTAAREKPAELEREAGFRSERRTALTEEIARQRMAIQERLEDLAAAAPPDSLPAEVRRAELRAELAAMRASVRAHEAELSSYDERASLLPKRRQRAQRRLSELELVVGEWGRLVASARDAEVQRARTDAEHLTREAAAQHPVLREVVEDTGELLVREQGDDGLIRTLAEHEDRRRLREQELVRLEASFASTQRKLRVAGLSDAMGRVLREQYAGIPRSRELVSAIRRLRRLLGEVQFEGIVTSELLLRVGDVEARLAELVAAAERDPRVTDVAAFREVALIALTQRADATRRVRELLHNHEQTLEGLIRAERGILDVAERYRAFVEKHILYVRSVEGGRLPHPRDVAEAAVWIATGPDWRRAARLVGEEAARSPAPVSALLLVVVALAVGRRRIAAALGAIGDRARRFRTDSYRLTVEATALTLLHALPLPLFLWTVGWLLGRPEVLVAGTGDIAAGARSIGLTLYPVVAFQSALRAGGLADVHFRWPSRAVAALRTELRWFVPLAAVAMGTAFVFRGHAVERFESSLGRVGFVVGAAALAVLTRRLVRHDGPVLAEPLGSPGSVVARTHRAWSTAAVALPLVLVLASLLGYHYTALRFADTYHYTLVLALVLVLARSLMSRWQFLARRRLAVEQARQKMRARVEEASSDGGTTSSTIDEELVDIPAVDAQTRRLFNGATALALLAGLYLIWSAVLPALAALERVELWPQLRIVEDTNELAPVPAEPIAAAEPSADAAPAATRLPLPNLAATSGKGDGRGATGRGSITLADVIVSILVLLVTAALARNVPGLLEIGILQRLPLDAGARYAVSTILRYAILMTGITAGLGAVGIGWSTVQWLAAALTFGLAFGLQEIFANFVSGLILLIERPIRVGDVVIVDGVEGKVSKIRMRATTITDWNRRELLVPNKQFITNSMVNMTLTDPVTRIVVPVGIAYGSDVRLARETLLAVAARCTNVLPDPAPSVVFREFGDSSLLLHLRVFIPNFEVWQQVMNDVHLGVDDAFREAGIEISFPQRDLHLRSVDESARGAFGRATTEEPS